MELLASAARHSPWPITMPERIITDVLTQADPALEVTLRPALFSDFTGQAKIKERLEISVEAAKRRKDPLDHTCCAARLDSEKPRSPIFWPRPWAPP